MKLVQSGLILIDTNIILELLLAKPTADECEKLLEAASKGPVEAVVTHFHRREVLH